MNENSVVSLRQKDEIDDPLTEILRTGARKLIVQAVEIEFDKIHSALTDGLKSHAHRDEKEQACVKWPLPSERSAQLRPFAIFKPPSSGLRRT